MAVFEVISIGDSELLANAFQAIAMLFSSGNMVDLIRSGFIVGLCFAAIRYTFTNKFELHHILYALIVYMVMFLPKATVAIEDVYTKEVREVDNIPIGVAFPMYFVSRAGTYLAQNFEQAFNTNPQSNMLESGYMASLQLLLDMRGRRAGTANSDPTQNGDLSRTLDEYVRRCVRTDLKLYDPGRNAVTMEGLMKSPDTWAAMRNDFVNIDFLLFTPDYPRGRQMSCNDGYVELDRYIRGNFQTYWDKYLRSIFRVRSGQNAAEEVQTALDILGVSAVDSQNFMINSLMSSYLQKGPAAFLIRPALERTRLHLSTSGSIFLEFARPLMAFAETFTVAAAPFVAFMLSLGAYGMSVAAKYFQLAIWVSLWAPIMAINNMYVHISTTNALARLSENAEVNGASLVSMGTLGQFYDTLATWVAVGGNLMAATPVLSMALMAGSLSAFSKIASNIDSAASKSIDTKSMAPDPMEVSAPLKVMPKSEYNPNLRSMSTYGVASPTESIGGTLASGITSQKQSVTSADQTMTKSLGEMQSTIKSHQGSYDHSKSFAENLIQSHAKQDQVVGGMVQSVMNASKMSVGENQEVSNALSMVLGGALGGETPIFSLKGKLEETLRATGKVDASKAKELSANAMQMMSSQTSGTEAFQHAAKEDNQHNYRSVFSTLAARQSTEQLMQAASRKITASESLSRMESAQNQVGSSAVLKYDELGTALANSPETMAQMRSHLFSHGNDPNLDTVFSNARKQMNSSGVSFSSSDASDALQGYLALKQLNPAAAAEILTTTKLPTMAGQFANIKPDRNLGVEKQADNVAQHVAQASPGWGKAVADGQNMDGGPTPQERWDRGAGVAKNAVGFDPDSVKTKSHQVPSTPPTEVGWKEGEQVRRDVEGADLKKGVREKAFPDRPVDYDELLSQTSIRKVSKEAIPDFVLDYTPLPDGRSKREALWGDLGEALTNRVKSSLSDIDRFKTNSDK
ncbi:MAG: conjugal transfer protein TraG [Magnetococcales bacterium]|nr:conjugal transfer protein TraG N-terminal domain-containing protein [Magnetococcales bacterium]NGZ25398.1 conjugal transfer protein TraG [Magnetococcales bacterium]